MGNGLLTVAKQTLLRGAAVSGVERFLRDSEWRRRRLLILCYHGLSLADEHLWSDLFVTPDHLAARLELLRASDYNVLPFDQAVQQLYRGTLPPRSVTLTFDDGFADFYLKAQPLLREFSTPAVVYLTTYYTRDQKPVFDPLLSYLLWKGQGKTVRLPAPFDRSVQIPTTPDDRDALHARIREHSRAAGWTAAEKDTLADEISGQINFDLDRLRAKRCFYLMSADELADLDQPLIDVQLHTHRHRTPRDESLFIRELNDNSHAIRELMPDRPEPVHFCYPSGDYDYRFLPWLREEGVVSATTCEAGLASQSDDPLLLPRLLDSMMVPESVFLSWLAGTASFLPRRSA
jgi:peptidoglycan/xylan/chitin deacetylase (PgdA/CDA1 family)